MCHRVLSATEYQLNPPVPIKEGSKTIMRWCPSFLTASLASAVFSPRPSLCFYPATTTWTRTTPINKKLYDNERYTKAWKRYSLEKRIQETVSFESSVDSIGENSSRSPTVESPLESTAIETTAPATTDGSHQAVGSNAIGKKAAAAASEDSEPAAALRFKDDDEDEEFEMPWSDIQDWALRDNLPKYTMMIPLTRGGKEATETYALWRTMSHEVTEISGYPIEFLQSMLAKQIKRKESALRVTPSVLPYLDEFDFTKAGGMSGRVYGIPGLLDGAKIETSPVANVRTTLPKGFIRTSDGTAAYELGRPARQELLSMEQITDTGGLLRTVSNFGSKIPRDSTEIEENPDQMLVRLGASTAILLAGATAVNMISHHLTVNVFWV